VEAGYASADDQDKTSHGLNGKRVECDEVWAFCYAKQKNVPAEKQGKLGCGDVWTIREMLDAIGLPDGTFENSN